MKGDALNMLCWTQAYNSNDMAALTPNKSDATLTNRPPILEDNAEARIGSKLHLSLASSSA